MYVCICEAVTEAQVVEAVESGVSEPDALVEALRFDDPSNCGRCADGIDRLMDLPCIREALGLREVGEAMETHPAAIGSAFAPPAV